MLIIIVFVLNLGTEVVSVINFVEYFRLEVADSQMTVTKMNRRKQQDKKLKSTVKSMIKSMSPCEIKAFDQTYALNPTHTASLQNLSDITRGVEVNQRVGNEVFLKHAEFRMNFTLNTEYVAYTSIRYIIFIDTMGVNAPVPADLLELGLLGTEYAVISPIYWEYRKRFVIKRDEVVNLNSGHNQEQALTFNIPLNLRSYNIGSATTFKNQLYILVVGNESNSAHLSTLIYNCRLQFTDE